MAPLKKTTAKKKAPKKKAAAKPQVQRDPSTGQLKKGSVLNPAGRPKGTGHSVSIFELRSVIQEVEKEKKKTLLKHFIERAFDEDAVLINALRKIMPDLKSIDISGNIDGEYKISIKRK